MSPRLSTPGDRAVIAKQLKRKPSADAFPVHRCAAGFPVVIENSGQTADGRPFPTLYWLTCPELRRGVSRLENAGLISEIRRLLEEDAGMRDRLFASDASYRKARDGNALNQPDQRDPRARPGIAGCRNILHLKCLHAHVADWLASGLNPVGEYVVTLTPPPADCRLCEAL